MLCLRDCSCAKSSESCYSLCPHLSCHVVQVAHLLSQLPKNVDVPKLIAKMVIHKDSGERF